MMKDSFKRYAGVLVVCLAAFGALSLRGLAVAGELPPLTWQLVAEGMTSPVEMVEPDDGTGRLLVADQDGRIHVVDPERGRQGVFLDIRDRLMIRNIFDERGLLGLALHPDFPDDPRFYIYYSVPLREQGPDNYDHTSRISEFRVSEDDPDRADPDSERVLMEIDQPYFNHNGGGLIFGPDDGYLYIGLGDGGSGGDPHEHGQNYATLLGSILRIHVEPDGDRPYTIPDDNPFVGDEPADEIYAYGLRNVWGMSFDTGGEQTRFFAADVGQELFEEVNIIVAGGNYGWNIREGFHCFDIDDPLDPPEECADEGARGEPLIDPIIEYRNIKIFADHPEAFGRSVTGGHVYRGERIPQLEGYYVFGDWSRTFSDDRPDGVALIAKPPEGDDVMQQWTVSVLDTRSHPEGRMRANVTAVGRDLAGEIYIMTNDSIAPTGDTGKLYRLVPAE